jgi:hypothetical protein
MTTSTTTSSTTQDLLRVINDPTSPYADAAANAMGRAMDDVIDRGGDRHVEDRRDRLDFGVVPVGLQGGGGGQRL